MAKRKPKGRVKQACQLLRCTIEQLFEKARDWRFGTRRRTRRVARDAFTKYRKKGKLAHFVRDFIQAVLHRRPGAAMT